MTKTKKAPKFVEPNLHVLQLHSAGEWLDYSSIKSESDMRLAAMNVDNGEGRMRIVKKQMGTTVVYS